MIQIFLFLFVFILQSATIEDCGENGGWTCDRCYCDDFWTGVDCSVCSQNKGCSGSTPYCSKTPYPVIAKNYQCLVAQLLTDYIDIKYFNWLTTVVESSDDGSVKLTNVSMDGWRDERGPILLHCDFATCTAVSDESQMVMDCEDGKCYCVTTCSSTLAAVTKGSLSAITLSCPAGKEECTLTAGGLPSINMQCIYGECVASETIPSNTESGEQISSTILVFLILFVLSVVLVLFFVFWSVIRRNFLSKYQIPISPEVLQAEMREYSSKEIIGATLSFQEISYSVPDNSLSEVLRGFGQLIRGAKPVRKEKVILRRISGVCRPGKITAIMGPSGAGKTSLLNILADWKASTTYRGQILVNGEPPFRTFRKTLSAYVLQEDHLVEYLTVREMLTFIARLRLERHLSNEFREERITDVLRDLKLEGVRDSVIGNPSGVRGLSGGERRRLSIAIELLSSPRILFLDEPTSGLDSSSAFTVMDSIRNLARGNRTVICTIHQPRMSIFNMCDTLLLLCQGRVVYSGPTLNAGLFLENQGIYNTANDNVADFLIDTVGSLDREGFKRLVKAWHEEGHRYQNEHPAENGVDEQENQIFNPETSQKTEKTEKRKSAALSGVLGGLATSVFGEKEESEYPKLPASAWKNHGVKGPLAIWTLCQLERMKLVRNVHLLRTHLVVNTLAGLLIGVIFLNTTNDLNGLQSKTGCLFLILTVVTFETLSSLEIFMKDRTIFLVQKTKGFYTAFSYLISKFLLQVVPLHGIAPVALATIVYHLAGLNSAEFRFWRFMIVVVLHSLVCVSLVLCLSSMFTTFAVANLLAVMLLLLSMIFSGFLINTDDIPSGIAFLYDGSFFHYSYEDLVINEFQGETFMIEGGGISISISGESFINQFGMDVASFDFNLFLLCGIMFFLLVVTYFSLHWRTLRENHHLTFSTAMWRFLSWSQKGSVPRRNSLVSEPVHSHGSDEVELDEFPNQPNPQ